jgi:hypothetical protein
MCFIHSSGNAETESGNSLENLGAVYLRGLVLRRYFTLYKHAGNSDTLT